MTLQSISIDQHIKASAEQVWERISTSAGIARWWASGDIAPILGHEFTMDMGKWGQVPCRVLEVVPQEKLAYTFDDFELHWTIVPADDGYILHLEHRGFDLSNPKHLYAFQNMGEGWKSIVLPRLADSCSENAL